jgi:hypothetical protein
MKPAPNVAGALGEGARDDLLEQPSYGRRYRSLESTVFTQVTPNPRFDEATISKAVVPDISRVGLEVIPAIPMLERKAEDLHPWPKGVLDAR